MVDFEKLVLLEAPYASWLAKHNDLQILQQQWSVQLLPLYWPWHLLGSPASTRSAVHPSLPSLCLNHKVIQPLPALTNHLGKRPRKYGSGGRKLGRKTVVKVGQRTGRKRSLMQWAVENATLDWLVGGRVTSLLGSKVGLLGVLSFKSGPVLFFAPGPRVFGNS